MNPRKLNKKIISQLEDIKKKYAKPRKTDILYQENAVEIEEEEVEEEFTAYCVFTKEGYFKRISLQSIRGNDEQKLKEGDQILFEGDNRDRL